MALMSVDSYRTRLSHEGEVTFTQSRGKMFLFLLVSIAFAIVGLVMAFGDGSIVVRLVGWAAVLFFGVLGIPVLLLKAIRPTPQLSVSTDRGVWLSQGDASWVAWEDIDEVGLGEIQGQEMVALMVSPELYEQRFAESSTASRGLAAANERVVGATALVIPSGLPIKPVDLAEWLGSEHADRASGGPGR